MQNFSSQFTQDTVRVNCKIIQLMMFREMIDIKGVNKKTCKYTALQNGVFVKLTAGGTYSYQSVNL
jgi:hypothetical protein